MKIIFNLFYIILIVVLSASCSNEDMKVYNGKGNRVVNVKDISLNFNDESLARGEVADNVVAVATADVDDEYMLVAELVNAGSIAATRADGQQAVDGFDVFTFYSQEAKGAPRYQKLADGASSFEVPEDGKSKLVFLGRGGTVGYNRDNVSLARNGCTFTTGIMNLCSTTMQFDGSSIPASVNLVMTPLFAQISGINVSQTTTDGWPMSVSDVKLTAGCQKNASVTVSGDGVTYTKTDSDETIALSGLLSTSSTTPAPVNVIPNNNDITLSAKFTLTGKAAKTLALKFQDGFECGARYTVNLSLRKKGITIKFYVNTQQLGVYNESFDLAQQDFLKSNNAGALSDANTPAVRTAYLKYGTTVSLPTAPKRETAYSFNPDDYMNFASWCTQKDCKSGLVSGNKITLTYKDFPSLKTTDVIELYAYYQPIYRYWDKDFNVYTNPSSYGWSLAQLKNRFSSTANYSTANATSSYFTVPTGADYKKYFGNGAVFFYDEGYTDDAQQGYWVKKWTYSKSNAQRAVVNSNGYLDVAPTDKVKNGTLPSGYDRKQFFFLPLLGFYYPSSGSTVPYANNGAGASGAIEGPYWSSDVEKVYHSTYNSTAFLSQGITLLSNGEGVRLAGQTGTSTYSGYNVNGFSPVADSSNAYRNALISTWPDDTYQK